MIERILDLGIFDQAVFYGINNSNINTIKALYPKIKIAARGSIINVKGNAEDIADFEEKIDKILAHITETNKLTEEDVVSIVKNNNAKVVKNDDLILFGLGGRPITARSANQRQFVKQFEENDMVFGVGPAGSGKTYTAIALAVRALKNKQVRKIILSRPAVEAGEKLGFLPGDMKDKIDPYLQPLYDALEDMIPQAKLKDYIENNVIQIAPLAFMRGRTLSDAIIILDEAQNTTIPQIKMFMTRLGWNAKMIITGDITQFDLPQATQSGLKHALHTLKDVKGLGFTYFEKSDIVRHRLVQNIVDAYEIEEKRNAQNQNQKNKNV